ncbi:hypothetical protein OG963_00575 [Streptomyces sp. NBC_01707]|uniref:hypothetical protein n=1 Tax=unclassified Streptomyces TaxID=2593676 RepID=UPI002E0F03DB|nr:hypothetical protein OG763_43755 [Streptomyces sp. NBC_01230]
MEEVEDGFVHELGSWHTFRGAVTESQNPSRNALGSATLIPKLAQRRSGANQEYAACGQERESEDGEKPTPDPHEPPLEWGVPEEVHPWMLESQSAEVPQEAGVGVGRVEVRIHGPLSDTAVVRRQRKAEQYQPGAQQQRDQIHPFLQPVPGLSDRCTVRGDLDRLSCQRPAISGPVLLLVRHRRLSDGQSVLPPVTHGSRFTECAPERENGQHLDEAAGAAPVLDPDPGNQLQCGPDGLVVPAAAGLEVGPGLTGTGVVGDPVAAAVSAWPYACDLDDNAGLVYADSAGRLRSEQRGGIVRYVSFFEERYYNNLTVPAGFDQPGANFETTITNPDPCHEALFVVIREADVDFNLPAGAGAAYGNGSDEMFYFRNSGSSTSTDIHTQTVKQFHNAVPLGPGASEVIPFDVTLGRGSGGATYNRIQINIRCLIISLPVVL